MSMDAELVQMLETIVKKGQKPKTIKMGDIELTVGFAGDKDKDDDDDADGGETFGPEPFDRKELIRYVRSMTRSTLREAKHRIDVGNSLTRVLVAHPLGDTLDRAVLTWGVEMYMSAATLHTALRDELKRLDPGVNHAELHASLGAMTVDQAVDILAKARAAAAVQS